MQQGKIVDRLKPRRPEDSLEAVTWQWQSGPNPDPWAEKDASKWSWQDYSHDHCLIIEEASSFNKEVADLGNYEIDLKKMVQVNKQFRNRMRRVRRRETSRFMMEMPEPMVVLKDQKTMIQAFGTIQCFLDEMMKRTPEAYGLYQRLRTTNLDSQRHEFEDIIQEVVLCIERGAETRDRIITARCGCQTTDILVEARKIVDFIKEKSIISGDFLKSILRVYTMETFLCYWLNELLRSENWEEMSVLTPFLVCLVYTFKRSEYIVRYQEPQGFINSLFANVGKHKLNLYRGAALTREQLGLYNPDKIKHFLWKGITSTSRDENIALNFMRSSLKKAKALNEQKVGVFFRIEANFASPEDYEGIIVLWQNSCGLYPEEQEVILAPGTVFKLRKTRLVESDVYEVSLKVKKSFEETKEDVCLPQEQAVLKDTAVIDGLPSERSFKLLETLKGNKSIRKLEIRNSGIEHHVMKEIENIRLTTNVKKEDVRFRDNAIVIADLGLFAPYLSLGGVNKILTLNKIRFKEGVSKGSFKDEGLEPTALVLSEEALEKFKQSDQLKELSMKITSANNIEELDLALPTMETDFLQCIRESKGLKSLRLKVNKNLFMDREGLEVLCQMIGSSKSLSWLKLELSLSDEGFNFLKETLGAIASIQRLSLDLRFCDKMSDEGLSNLRSALLSLTSLRHLSLDFLRCNKISDKGLNHIRAGLSSSLQGLSLNFQGCDNVSDEGLHYIKVGLLSLSSLRQLSLNFTECNKISDEGLNHLKRGFLSLSSLVHLSLNFKRCNKIADKGLSHLKGGLLSLTHLEHLSLNFDGCFNISSEGLGHIQSALLEGKFLQHLSLSFNNCSEIPNEGLSDLKSCLLSHSSLKHLSLSLAGCKRTSDKELNEVADGLKALKSLQHLSVNLSGCNEISDEGLKLLKSAVGSLGSLQHLSLNFTGCDKVSDEGINLIKNGIVSLPSVRHLSLHFGECNKVSDKGLDHLKSGLLSLISLYHLSLNFDNCSKISNEGPKHLGDGIKALTAIQHLSLNFKNCWQISNEGLNHLKGAVRSLGSLQHLSLNFAGCDKVSDKERTNFCNELKFITNVSFE